MNFQLAFTVKIIFNQNVKLEYCLSESRINTTSLENSDCGGPRRQRFVSFDPAGMAIDKIDSNVLTNSKII